MGRLQRGFHVACSAVNIAREGELQRNARAVFR